MSLPLAVVQVRMSSTRLPGKVLADICGEPALSLLLRRLQRSSHIARIVIAASDHSSDDPIVMFAQRWRCEVVRGPLDDVLTRFLLAIEDHHGPVVRITGDCPLIDPVIVDKVIDAYQAEPGCIYASNTSPYTFPDGLDVEVIDADRLRELAAEDLSAEEREHVTLALHDPRNWPIPGVCCVCSRDLSHLRWTIDTQSDLDHVRALVERLGGCRYSAGMDDIVQIEESISDSTLAFS